MQTIEIRITVPDGVTINIVPVEGDSNSAPAAPYGDPVGRYWRDYLSASSRKLFAAAARLEDHGGSGYSFDDLAANLSLSHQSVQSWHRNSGRTAKRWRAETGTPEPIRLEALDYRWDESADGMRTWYRLPGGVGAEVLELLAEG